MASEREIPTTTDYVVTALSPVLIMLMVGSLVFFLVEVMYDGKYSGRLLYTLFFFVIGAVLVARIAIETDASRASAYGLILGIVTYLALLTYVEYPSGGWLKSFGWLVNLGLMLLIWWSANKLTWDCTHIDEKRKGAGRGLLSAAGLDADSRESEDKNPEKGDRNQEIKTKPTKSDRSRREKKKKQDSKLWDWIEAYKKHREAERKGPHTPGVWVIYFALAALPLFALGQSLVDSEDAGRRQNTFLQMVVYVGSALALLVTTSFLALRRYLRQRKAKVPMTMTASWLGLGGLLIAVFLVLGAFLPRPHSEVPWFGITKAGKLDREASRHAMRKDSAGKGEGANGNQTKAGDGNSSGRNGKPGGGNTGEKGSGGKGQKGNSKSGEKGKSEGKSDSGDNKGNGQDKQGEQSEDKQENEGKDSEGKTDRESDESKDKAEGKDGSSETQSSPQLGQMLDKAAQLVKWIVFAIVAVLVVIGVALAVLSYLAPFTSWAQNLLNSLRNWWAGLFGRRKPIVTRTATESVPLGPVRPPPFHEFSNPFADGSAERRSPAELVDYTFVALDSWAWDRERGRDPHDTPLEFCSHLAEAFPDIEEVLDQFARLHARVTYSASKPPGDTLPILEQMWEGMVYGVAVG